MVCKRVISPTYTRWWQLKYFLSSPLFGEDEPILTSIFFRWVVQPPTYLYMGYIGVKKPTDPITFDPST